MKKVLLIAAVLILVSANAADQKNPKDAFDQVMKAVDALNDCQVRFQLFTTAGKNQEMRLLAVEDAKYIHHPALYFQKRTKVEASYKEQAQAGFQEIYHGDTDTTDILMPGAFRALGLITLLPEDPKGFGMNGGSVKTMAPWDMVDFLARMVRISKLSEETVTHNNKQLLLFTLDQNPGTYYYAGNNRFRMFVDPQTLMPTRFEWWVPGTDKPASYIEYEAFSANTGLKPEAIGFEGFKSPFSLIKSPPASEIDPYLKPIVRTKNTEPAPDVATILAGFNKAADGINSYRADLSMRFRLGRLRLYREDRFAWHRNPYWFVLVTTAQKSDYILLNHSAGAVLWIDPKDSNFHIIGGGVQRILGEQVFSGNDYKFFSTLEDNPYELDFARIQALLKNFNTAKGEAWTVDYQGKKMHEVKFERHIENLTRAPMRINLVIDPETNLPRVIEFSGYDDPKAYVAVTVDNIKTNVDLKPGETKF